MDIARIREMSDRELDDALTQAKQDLWSARFALSTRQLNDTSSIPQTRRTIARILTVQREPDIAPVEIQLERARGAVAQRRCRELHDV